MEYHYIRVKTNSKKELPDNTFLGSTIRGALGEILKKQNLYIYNKIYGTSNEYRIFRLDIPFKSKSFDFGIYIFVNDLDVIRTILQSLMIMLHMNRITGYRYKFPKSELFLNDKKIKFDKHFSPKAFMLTPKKLSILKDKKSNKTKDIIIKFYFPVLVKSSIEKPEEILEDIIVSILKRKYYLEYRITLHRVNEIKNMPDIHYKKIGKTTLEYKKVYRKKSSDNKVLYFEGLVGKLKVLALDMNSYKILKQGEVIGAGKQVSYGLGKIKIKVLNEKKA